MLKNKIVRVLDKFFFIKVKKGLCRGLYIKGNFLYNKRPATYSLEEIFLSNYDFRNKSIFDVGANIGMRSMFFSINGAKMIYAFEPDPDSYKIMNKNIKKNNLENIYSFNIGVGHLSSKEKFYSLRFRREESTFDRRLLSGISHPSYKEISTYITSLDAFSEKNDVEIDFVKIDTEGYEVNVIKGMANIIKIIKPDLYFEIHGPNLGTKQENLIEVYSILNNNNYKIINLKDRHFLNSDYIYYLSDYSNCKFFASAK